MAKFEETAKRIFQRIFVCKNCKSKVRTDMGKIINGKIYCKACGSKHFRPLRKK